MSAALGALRDCRGGTLGPPGAQPASGRGKRRRSRLVEIATRRVLHTQNGCNTVTWSCDMRSRLRCSTMGDSKETCFIASLNARCRVITSSSLSALLLAAPAFSTMPRCCLADIRDIFNLKHTQNRFCLLLLLH